MARSGSVFLVNLAGLDLPKSALDELEKEIDAVVDRNIAGLAKFKGKVASAPLGPEIRGKYVLLKEFQGAFGG